MTPVMLDEYKSLKLLQICKSNIFLPILELGAEAINSNSNDVEAVINAFEAGFELGLIANNTACRSCIESDGECGYDWDSKKFICHCTDQDYDHQCGVSPSPTKGTGGLRTFKALFLAYISPLFISYHSISVNIYEPRS